MFRSWDDLNAFIVFHHGWADGITQLEVVWLSTSQARQEQDQRAYRLRQARQGPRLNNQ